MHSQFSAKDRLILLDLFLTTDVCAYSYDRICIGYIHSELMRICLILEVFCR